MKGRSELAVQAADEVVHDMNALEPCDLDVELMAVKCGAFVVWRTMRSEDARIVRRGDDGIIRANKALRGTAKSRFDIGHECAHHKMHRAHDQLERCMKGDADLAKSGTFFRIEREADDFTASVLMPRFMFAPRCDPRCNSLFMVGAVATEFGTSLTATAIRYAEVTAGAAAVVYAVGGVIKWVAANDAYAGKIVMRRQVDERSRAAAMFRGVVKEEEPQRVDPEAWGFAAAKANKATKATASTKRRTTAAEVELFEHSVRIEEADAVLTWVTHAPIALPAAAF